MSKCFLIHHWQYGEVEVNSDGDFWQFQTCTRCNFTRIHWVLIV